MGCKTCNAPEVDSKYNCLSCCVATGHFKWCVITGAKEKNEGNQYDKIVDLNEQKFDIFDGHELLELEGKKHCVLHYQETVFEQGEIFPVDPDFEREMCAAGRRADKWDVEYEIFNPTQYKQAILKAIEATIADGKEPTNLDYLEEKYIEKVKFEDRIKQLNNSEDPLKLIYQWVKERSISLEEMKRLLTKENNNG